MADNVVSPQVAQLEELLAVRHSVFVVGNAGAGKSQVLKSLHKTHQIMKRRPVWVDLNPKAVTNDELFGIINPATREWKDGKTMGRLESTSRGTLQREGRRPALYGVGEGGEKKQRKEGTDVGSEGNLSPWDSLFPWGPFQLLRERGHRKRRDEAGILSQGSEILGHKSEATHCLAGGMNTWAGWGGPQLIPQNAVASHSGHLFLSARPQE